MFSILFSRKHAADDTNNLSHSSISSGKHELIQLVAIAFYYQSPAVGTVAGHSCFAMEYGSTVLTNLKATPLFPGGRRREGTIYIHVKLGTCFFIKKFLEFNYPK